MIGTDTGWASNVDDRRSVDTVHLFFGRALLETSTCTQQVTALNCGGSEFKEFFWDPHVHDKYDTSFLRWTSKSRQHEDWLDGQEADA